MIRKTVFGRQKTINVIIFKSVSKQIGFLILNNSVSNDLYIDYGNGFSEHKTLSLNTKYIYDYPDGLVKERIVKIYVKDTMLKPFIGLTQESKVTEVLNYSPDECFFSFEDCNLLTKIPDKRIAKSTSRMFKNTRVNQNIYLDGGSINLDYFLLGNSLFNSNVEINYNVLSIREFFNGTGITTQTINIPTSVTNMRGTFYDCRKFNGEITGTFENVADFTSAFVNMSLLNPLKMDDILKRIYNNNSKTNVTLGLSGTKRTSASSVYIQGLRDKGWIVTDGTIV